MFYCVGIILGAIVTKRNIARPLLAVIAVLVSNVAAQAEIELIPGVVKLSTTQARQRLVVQEKESGEYLGQVTEGLEFGSSDESVVKVIDGRAVPVGNGTAMVTVKSEAGESQAEVHVTGQEKEFRWSFRNHVESVLSKAGCNSGACHGARAGQNGFRLTLFGFDLAADYSYLTRQARGRRIVPTDPGRSLLLTKPTGVVPHKGGVRLDVNEIEYRVLAEWIAEGTVGPSDSDAVIDNLEVLPRYSSQKPGDAQQLVVLAHFSDGSTEDVTRWAKYKTVNQNVALVGDHGEVSVVGPGEGAIKVWYLNINQLAFVSVPFENNLPKNAFENEPAANFIDELVNEKLKKLRVPPSPLCDDATFVRRTFLDSSGILPTHGELTAFLQDETPSVEKRARLVEALLQRSEFVDYWSYKWSDLLLVNSAVLPKAAVDSYYKWIRERVDSNLPWDEFVRQIVTASGSTLVNGAANFYSLHQSPEDMAETVSQAFMGLSINCAKCHNHPLEKWTNDQYYGMANMFSRVRA
ncbi:MAG TPA: S-layer protein, partial [Planctomycetaceae bacterium]|nr:S-layer protein [Planctomycetaceae bacterium]